MTWKASDPQGNEAAKVRFDVLPYCAGSGFDLGCGPSKVWPHLTGVDNLLDNRLFGIQMKPDLVVRTVERMPMFADGCVETVFSSHTLEHIQDHVAALREWWRLLAPGGHLVLYLPHCDLYPRIGTPGANPDHKHDFAPEDIVDAMTIAAPDWSLVVNQVRDQGTEYSFLQVYRKEAPGAGRREPWRDPKPERTAGVVRVGGHGDALWSSSVAAHLHAQGYAVTVYTSKGGAEVLRHDPHIARLVVVPEGVMDDREMLQYWAHEATKFDRWVNLIGSVEHRLLFHETSVEFFHPHRLRHQLANVNYLERIHDYADVPHEWRQRFYPSEAEVAWARKWRAELPGPFVVINPAGSGPVKYWPHARRLMELLAERRIYSMVIGDVKNDPTLADVEPYGTVIGMGLPVRAALTLATLADAVVATESLVANAVAFEPMLKIITLSHSSNENLTKHWRNTAAIEPAGLACHPCHRIHPIGFTWCARDQATGASACQAMARAEPIARFVVEYLEKAGKLPAAA